jgi:hypothetical protein
MSDIAYDTLKQHYTKLLAHGEDPPLHTPDERAEFIRNNVLSVTDELHEALNEVGWKPWATSRHFNREAYLHELADAYLFLKNLVLAAYEIGDDIDDLEREFMVYVHERIARSIARQEANYDGVSSKCPGCHRALEDVTVREVQIVNAAGTVGQTVRQCGACNHMWEPVDGE